MTLQAEATVPIVTEPTTNGAASTNTLASQNSTQSPSTRNSSEAHLSAEPLAATYNALQPTSALEPPPPFESLPSAAAPPPPSPTPSMIQSNRVAIRVGEKEFFTTRSTLAESRLFTDLFTAQPARTEFFVDDDPDLFAQVLRFLRTRRYPLFWSRDSGHDFVKYQELLAAARFYKVDVLEMWLAEKRYQGAVWLKTDYKTATLYGQDQLEHMQEVAWPSHARGQVLHIQDKLTKAWMCPAKLWRHDGNQNKCFRLKCARPDGKPPGVCVVDMKVVEVKAVVTSVEIRESVLQAGANPEVPPPYQG